MADVTRTFEIYRLIEPPDRYQLMWTVYTPEALGSVFECIAKWADKMQEEWKVVIRATE